MISLIIIIIFLLTVSPGFIESISTSSTFKPISSSNVGDDTSVFTTYYTTDHIIHKSTDVPSEKQSTVETGSINVIIIIMIVILVSMVAFAVIGGCLTLFNCCYKGAHSSRKVTLDHAAAEEDFQQMKHHIHPNATDEIFPDKTVEPSTEGFENPSYKHESLA